ncbi:MAG: NAD(P)H-dependent oxidoreductase subunit E [candidate division WOR-3 bacterium]|nr:MAG: NAD(P)H-dependent oxidoreductase subunit E [candidate division WOR-3 bacterium]
MKINEKTVKNILKQNNHDKSNLLAILNDIQAEYNWLPPQTLKIVAEALGMPLIDIYGVASFYHAFSLTPRGKHVVTCCQGTACHVRGAPFVLKRLQDQLGVDPGCTTKDEQFTLETVNCLGACALAPIIVIDGHYYGQATVQKVDGMLIQYSQKKTTKKTKSKKKRSPKTKRRAKKTPAKKAKNPTRKLLRKKVKKKVKKKSSRKKTIRRRSKKK